MTSKVVAHFRIGEEIGAGGMGIVYRAHDLRLNRNVALKILWDHFRTDETAWARLLAEARAASRLNHPNICTIYDVGEEDGRAYIAMELVEGRNLRACVPGRGWPAPTVTRYGIQIAEALVHAHERGIFHGDLRSVNIILGPDGLVKVLDFGFARSLRDEWPPDTTSIPGDFNPATLSSSAISNLATEVSQRERDYTDCDIRQFGRLLYEMVTGQAFEPQSGAGSGPSVGIDSNSSSSSRIPKGLRLIMGRCIGKAPNPPYRRAQEVLDDLKAELAPSSVSVQVALPRKINRVGLGIVATLLILAGLFATTPSLRRHFFGRFRNPASSIPQKQVPPPLKAEKQTPTSLPAKLHGNPDIKVWANDRTRIYHCPGDVWYGKTKEGRYMSQERALQAGYRPSGKQACP